jgi:glycosyltransferase involved in cell wall biosynthesis
MNKPIIASNLGGSMETVLKDKSGLLYNSKDPKELARNINRLMETDKISLRLMGEQGRKNVERKFNVDQMCQTTFTEYKKLLK